MKSNNLHKMKNDRRISHKQQEYRARIYEWNLE